MAVGVPQLRIEKVQNRRLRFKAETACIQCDRPLVVDLDSVAAVFRIGNEFLGVCCDACLDPPSQAKVQQCRAAGEVPR